MRLLSPLLLAILVGIASAQNPATLLHTLDGTASSARIGEAVAGAGDVNADGHDDVIVGSPHESASGMNEAGKARVISGLDGSILHTFAGAGATYRFGCAVDGVGDLNGDGHADFIVGAYSASYIGSFTGGAVVYSGADGAVLHLFTGASSGLGFGTSVAGAGDVDGDGVPDVIVGAPLDGINDNGSATVYSGATGNPLYTFVGSSLNGRLGTSVAGAGDVNGDGHADLIASAIYDGTAGSLFGGVQVFSGLDGSPIRSHHGTSSNSFFGVWVNGGGDVNGDGHADYVVGSSADDTLGSNLGSVTVYSGIDGSVLHQFGGNTGGGKFGWACACSADVDGDGHADIIVGEPFDDAGPGGGSVTVFSGADGSVLHTILADAAYDRLGVAVDLAGDVDRDGFADFVIGAPYNDAGANNAGRATVWTAPTYPFMKYRTGYPVAHRLDCDWVPDGGDPNSLTATIVCDGATPGALGLWGLSLARIDYLAFGYLPLLIANDPINLIDTGNFGFDAAGTLAVPGSSRQAPYLAGSYVYLQFFETSPIISCSPGLRLLIAP